MLTLPLKHATTVAVLVFTCTANGNADMLSRMTIERTDAVQALFPQPIALASSWDPALVREANAAVASEVRARGGTIVLGPTLDVARDPRRGRVEQTFGEDPYLVGEMGVAAVEGLQGMAALQHFAGPGLPNEGSEAGPAPVSERELREVFLPPFEEVIKRTGARVIVPSRNEIDGVPVHANKWLLRDVLRGEWKYKGKVAAAPGAIGELQSVYHVASSPDDAVRLAMDAGVDAEVTERQATGTPSAGYGEKTRALALKAAQRSITLLKNDGTLPIRPGAKVAMIEVGAVKDLRVLIGARAQVVAKPGEAQLIVVAVGLSMGSGSDAAAQRAILDELKPLGKPIVVVLAGERPALLTATAQAAHAIVAAWGLGDQGGNAIAGVLFGNVNPGGKLPVTLARNAGQLPLFYNAKPSARRGYLFDTSEPLYAFGAGLSYTTFELGVPRLSAATMRAGGSVKVSVDVRNSGKVAGDETVQLYIRDKVSSVTRPVKELKGFERVSLAPGEKRTVTFTLNAHSLEMWDERMRRVVEPGEFDIMTGPDSTQLQTATLTVAAGAGK